MLTTPYKINKTSDRFHRNFHLCLFASKLLCTFKLLFTKKQLFFVNCFSEHIFEKVYKPIIKIIKSLA